MVVVYKANKILEKFVEEAMVKVFAVEDVSADVTDAVVADKN